MALCAWVGGCKCIKMYSDNTRGFHSEGTLSARLKRPWDVRGALLSQHQRKNIPSISPRNELWQVSVIACRKCQSAFWAGCRGQVRQKLWERQMFLSRRWSERRTGRQRCLLWLSIPLLCEDGGRVSIAQRRICWLGPRLRQVDDLCIQKSFCFPNPWLFEIWVNYAICLWVSKPAQIREGGGREGGGSWQSEGWFWQGETSEPHLISTFVPKSSWAAVRGGPAAGDYQSQRKTQLSWNRRTDTTDKGKNKHLFSLALSLRHMHRYGLQPSAFKRWQLRSFWDWTCGLHILLGFKFQSLRNAWDVTENIQLQMWWIRKRSLGKQSPENNQSVRRDKKRGIVATAQPFQTAAIFLFGVLWMTDSWITLNFSSLMK